MKKLKVKSKKTEQEVAGGRWSASGKQWTVVRGSWPVGILLGVMLLLVAGHGALTTVRAQTTEFTYQGRLLDNSLPPTANYDFEFSLWDALANGTQQGTTQTLTGVAVANGIFTVRLNFGSQFTGAARFLQIAVRPAGGGAYTTLAPRQSITSSPYSVKSALSASADGLSVACNLCVTDAHILSIDGAKVTGTVANATNAVNATTAVNVSGIVPIANGGTGSSTKNFVDLSTDQSGIGGNKTFTGNIGLGTTTPVGKLHINVPGSGNPISALTLDVGTFGTGTNATNSYFFKVRDLGIGSPAFLIRGDGNIGIATDAPAERLDVIGNIKASGTISGRGTLPWQVVSGLSQQAQPNNGYMATNDAQVTVTLPASPNIGDIVRVSGTGSGGWKIAQNAGQQILGTPLNLNGSLWTPRESNRNWQSVASSADGTKLVALGGLENIYTSTDSGVSWTPRFVSTGWVSVASSADGTKLVALAGNIYTSTDSGVNWTLRESSRQWKSVASSADGTKLVAVVNGGQIYTSTDSGVNWTPRESNRSWYSVASSADGAKLVAVVYDGQIYTSTDSGVSWTPRASGLWWSVASSADGTKLVVAETGSAGTLIYTSNDSGVTWMPRSNAGARDWKSVASSADGNKLVAVVFTGQIYISNDAGVSWTSHESFRNWWSVASSADGTKLVAVVANGQIYTSAAIPTPGTAGYLVGGQYSSIELQYIGNGLFLPLSHEGAITGN